MSPERKQRTNLAVAPIDMRVRTKKSALRVINLYAALPESVVAQVLGKQMLRSGTSVGAHYREDVRSRSNAEYASKLDGALQELEETVYWMELLTESNTVKATRLTGLMEEADELTAILTTCSKRAKARLKGHSYNDLCWHPRLRLAPVRERIRALFRGFVREPAQIRLGRFRAGTR